MRVRVVSFNVESLQLGAEAVRSALADLEPDVVLVQECRSGRAALRLAGTLEMEGVTSHRPFKRVRNAVLFRRPWRLAGVEVHNLSRQGRTLRRGFIAARLRQPGVRLTAVSAHLGLVAKERERHARELTDILSGAEDPVVIGADLNEGPAGNAARWISERFYDAFALAGQGRGETFPAGQPTARIDFLFAGEGLRIQRAWVSMEGEPASDHRPIAADVELPEGLS